MPRITNEDTALKIQMFVGWRRAENLKVYSTAEKCFFFPYCWRILTSVWMVCAPSLPLL